MDLEDDIETLATETREQHNQLSSGLYKLPDELIAAILLQLFHDHLQEWHEDHHSSHMYIAPTFHRAYAFCRRVRAVAIRTPELWTFVPLVNERQSLAMWTDICLARGENADHDRHPLTLHFNVATYGLEWHHEVPLVDKTIQLAPRTRVLYLVFANGNRGSADDIVFQLLARQSWPILTSLTIKLDMHSKNYAFHLYHKLFGDACKTLIELRVKSNACLPWDAAKSPEFPSLEHLTIRSLSARTAAHIQHWLLKLPVLQSVNLGFTYDDEYTPDTPPPSGPVSFPRLRSAKLVGQAHCLLYFIKLLPSCLESLDLYISQYNRTDPRAGIARHAEQPLAQHIAERCRPKVQDSEHTHSYTLALECLFEGFHVRFRPSSSRHSKKSARGGITVDGHIRQIDTAQSFAQAASVFEILPTAGFVPMSVEHIFYILKTTAFSSVKTLKLHAWDREWEKPQRIESLETLLRYLKQDARPLETLSIVEASESARLDQLERGWKDEGLIKHMVRQSHGELEERWASPW